LTDLDIFQAQSIKKLRIKPEDRIRFDNSLNLLGNDKKFQDNYEIYLENFDGFDFNTNPFNDLVKKRGGLLDISNIDFDFFLNSDASLTQNCIFQSELSFRPLFSSFDTIYIENDVTFRDRVCPLAFQNANIKKLVLNRQRPAERLMFTVLNSGLNKPEELNSKVEQFEVYNSEIRVLDLSLLNQYVFKDLVRLTVASANSLMRIQADLFSYFKSLKEFSLKVGFLKTYLANQDLEWTYSLNDDVAVDLSNVTQLADQSKQFKLAMTDLASEYTFPDEDFCLVKDYPHFKLIFPVLNSKPDLECSCTLAFLLQYAKYYKDMREINTPSVRKCLSDPASFEQIVKSCDFEKRIKDCEPITTTTTSPTSPTASSTSKPTTVTPTVTTPATSTPLTIPIIVEPSDDTGVIVGSVIGGLAGATLLGAGGYFLYKHVMKRKVVPDNDMQMEHF
jgi:hypothetical protein